MNSLLLRTAARIVLLLELAFALVFLFRGHNQPGGGFIGGLIAAGAFSVYALAFRAESVRRLLWFRPASYMGCGLFIAAGSGLLAVFLKEPYMTAQWWGAGEFSGPLVGTPLLFDLGVFLTVLGMTMTVILILIERWQNDSSERLLFRRERGE